MSGFRLEVRRDKEKWDVALSRLRAARERLRKRQVRALRQAALILEAEIKRGLASGVPGGGGGRGSPRAGGAPEHGGAGFRPLAPLTILTRRGRSNRPLLDTGALLGSITTTVNERALTAFVGVSRSARGRDGKRLDNVALIHEFGTRPYVISVTPEMRRFFWALHFESGGAIQPISPRKTQILHPGIPARPFLGPAFAAARPLIEQVLRSAFTAEGGPV